MEVKISSYDMVNAGGLNLNNLLREKGIDPSKSFSSRNDRESGTTIFKQADCDMLKKEGEENAKVIN